MRQPVVSRTFTGLQITALILNLENREQGERTFFIERIPVKPRKKDEYIRKRIESFLSEKEKFVTVLSETQTVKRFYMTEAEFIEKAHETELLKSAKKESEETE